MAASSLFKPLLLLLFAGLLAGHSPVNAQNGATVVIKGRLAGDSLKPLSNCYIRINRHSSRAILAYFNTGNESTFTATVPFAQADTFFITATHVGYHPALQKVYIPRAGATVQVDLGLAPQSKILDEVKLGAPPVWVRGDTTFFRADAFKEGEEKKLKDLITKMPGFEIDDNGNLLYKKRRVEKVMIDGEEIFADKVKLMLNNFPVHVLENIQAIENQSNNRLLKGFTNESRVFLNLGLNKEKLKAVFGDGEAGIGTRGRYFLNPVIFSMYGKLKAGFIGNYNSIGQGLGWKIEDELNTDPSRLAQNWLMNPRLLQLINNFETNRYLTNQQIHQQVQVNLPATKKLKNTVEARLLHDRQQQQTFYNSSIYNGSQFVHRHDSNQIDHRPLIISLQNRLEWNIDSLRLFTSTAQWHHNTSASRLQALYHQQGAISRLDNTISNSWNSLSLSAEFAHRQSATIATRLYGNVWLNHYPQQAVGISALWNDFFGLADPSYTRLSSNLNYNGSQLLAGWERMQKTRRGLFTAAIEGAQQSNSINNRLMLDDPADATKWVEPAALNNTGTYHISSLQGSASFTVKALRQPITLKMLLGAASLQWRENQGRKMSTILPVYRLEAGNRTRFTKYLTASFGATLSQTHAEPYNLTGIVLPRSISLFANHVNTAAPIRSFQAQAGMLLTWRHLPASTSVVAMYNRALTGFATLSGLYNFIQVTTDTLVRNPGHSFSASINNNHQLRRIAAHLHYGGGLSVSQRMLLHRNEFYHNRFLFYYGFMSVRKKWGTAYFVEAKVHFSTSENRLPQQLKGSLNNRIGTVRGNVLQRWVLGKQTYIVLNTEYFNNNLFSTGQQSFLFADVEANYNLPGKPLSFGLKWNNITNVTYYTSMVNLPLQQSLYSVPLVKRNMLISARYQL